MSAVGETTREGRTGARDLSEKMAGVREEVSAEGGYRTLSN